MRLDKAVTFAGLSRANAKKAISAGRVSVNGVILKDSGQNVSEADLVFLDGAPVRLKNALHLMLNKPAGFITATEDAKGQSTVLDLIPREFKLKDLGPVGRLDKDVTGLVILTTDGQLAHRLISPKRDIEKMYTATVEGALDEACVKAFYEGIKLSDFVAKSARLEIVSAGADTSVCNVYITEGKFHQVKRMLASVGHPVIKLKRLRISSLWLDERLAEGECRELTYDEETSLYEAAGMGENE